MKTMKIGSYVRMKHGDSPFMTVIGFETLGHNTVRVLYFIDMKPEELLLPEQSLRVIKE